jgi:hypothetical protein
MAAFDALLSKTISSVINGMSQQPAAIRLKSQCEEQVNCLSDVVSGVSRRPPTQNQMSPNWTGSGWPSSNPAGGVYVFLAGTEMTVTDNGAAGVPTNYTYLDFDTATYTAAEAFATVTVADYTFIVNKTKTVAMSGNSGASSTVARTQDHEFLMWMGAVPDDTTVNLTIGGTATSAATGATLDSSGALDALMTNLTGAGFGTDVTGTLAGFTNWKFTHPDNANWLYGYQFQNALEYVVVEDDFGNTVAKYAATSTAGDEASIQKFTDLPAEGYDGFIVKVAGSDGNEGDNFYVVYNDAEKIWKETTASGLDNQFDADTMPHALVYQGGTTFNFEPAGWSDREKGDALSAPEPTFVGREIKDIVLHKSRLTVAADENVMSTEANAFFNFWPTTVTTVVASDPIDVSAGGNEVNILEYLVPFQRNLTLFSPTGGTQQELVGSDVEALTVENARVEERTTYQMANVKPVAVGKNIYFIVERNQWSGLHEYGFDGLDRAFTEDVAGHVPEFMPRNVIDVSGSRAENIVVACSSEPGYENRLYIYRFWYIGDQKVQSSWSYWEFDSAAKMKQTFWIDSTLYILMERADGPHLEKINFRETSTTDYDGNAHESLIHLDKQFVTFGAYFAVGDYTQFSVPWDPTEIANEADYGEVVMVKVRGTLGTAWPEAEIGEVIVPTIDPTTTDGFLRVEGDYSDGALCVGLRYKSTYTPSEVVLDEGSDENPRPMLSGNLIIKRWRVLYKDTIDFTVVVSYTDGDDTYTYNLSHYDVGDLPDLLTPGSGEYAFPVGGRSEHAQIAFTSESVGPFTLTAMEWEGRIFSRAKRG